MNLRPALLVIFGLGALAVVCWLYYGVARPRLAVAVTPPAEVLDDLGECCRRKRVQAVQYDYYAEIADREEACCAAELFRALALSARVQEQLGAELIGRLGGRYRPPQRILIFRSTTAGNLRRSLEHEQHEDDSLRRSRIEYHIRCGNHRCAEALIHFAAADLRCRMLLEHCCETPEAKRSALHYAVCPHCGNPYETLACDSYCPHCLTDGRRFIRFERRAGTTATVLR